MGTTTLPWRPNRRFIPTILWELSPDHVLSFMLAPTREIPDPPASDTANGEAAAAADDEEDDEDLPPVDVTIEVVDGDGRSARVTLSDYGPVRRPLETYILRRQDQERERFEDHWELIQQTYAIPLGDFLAREPALDASRLREIRFVFDLAPAGEVAIDQVGLSLLEPGFLSARVEGPSR